MPNDDADCDGVLSVDDCDDSDPSIVEVNPCPSWTTDTADWSPDDTAIIVIGWRGVASVEPGTSYDGTETLWVQDWKTINDTAIDVDFCAWTWDVADNGSAPSIGCTDPDGNACDFEFYLEGTNGAEVPGTDCSTIFTSIGTTMSQFGYGYIDDYQYQGTSYGTRLLGYDDTNQQWIVMGILGNYLRQTSAWDAITGDFEYSYWQGAYYVTMADLHGDDTGILP
jgi:hypothetical protein